MTAKEYIQNAKNSLEGQLEKVNYDLKTKNGFYNVGMIAGLLTGLCIVSSSPWFAIPVFGGVLSCLMGKKHLNNLLGSRKKRLEGELNHVNGVASKGLDTRPETDKKRKSFLDNFKKTRDIQEKEFSIPPLMLQPLVENAVKHGLFYKAGGGTVIVRSCSIDGKVVLSVEDDGIGFDAAARKSDFDQHEHHGLANVRSRVEKMLGGTLQTDSNPDRGSIVTLEFPIDNYS